LDRTTAQQIWGLMAAFATAVFQRHMLPVMRPSHVAAGEGVIDVLAIVKTGEGHTEWLIVELDQCGTDMLTAIAKRCKYLVGGGLARGKS